MFKKFLLTSFLLVSSLLIIYPSQKEKTKFFDYCYSLENIISRNSVEKSKILSKNFIRSFKGKIINIHPSLLPKYKGLNTFDRAIKAGDKVSGCTVHFVDEKLDNGQIIIKRKVLLNSYETSERLKKRVQTEEYMAYSIAIRRIYSSA